MMSRKNLLTSFTEKKLTAVNSETEKTNIASSSAERSRSRGAFGAITKSIDALSQQAQSAKQIEAKLLEGNAVIDLDTSLIDGSFVRDRLSHQKEEFEALLSAIKNQGQLSPILVRPHPTQAGRYMTVFGHRRLRAAKELGLNVKAVVKDIDDISHIVAQGQENSARADLSFIEKAVFAHGLEEAGYGRELIMAALSVDKAQVSKMLSVVDDVSISIIEQIGAAQHAGRDKWYGLGLKLRDKSLISIVVKLLRDLDTEDLDSDQRLDRIIAELDKIAGPQAKLVRKPKTASTDKSWTSPDQSVSVAVQNKPKCYEIRLSEKDRAGFGSWIKDQMDRLFEEYQQTKSQ